MLCRPTGRWADSRLNLSAVSKRPSSDVPQPSSHIVPPCHLTAGEEGWSVSCLFPSVKTPLAWAETRSSGPDRYATVSETWNDRRRKKLVTWASATVDASGRRPLGEIVNGNQDISVPTLTHWEGSCYVEEDPLERCSDAVLVHQAPDPGSRTPARCAYVTLLAPSLDVASCV
jgi:hypothetical protein